MRAAAWQFGETDIMLSHSISVSLHLTPTVYNQISLLTIFLYLINFILISRIDEYADILIT